MSSKSKVRWSRGGARRVSSKSMVIGGDRKSLQRVLGERRTKAIEKKMVEALWNTSI